MRTFFTCLLLISAMHTYANTNELKVNHVLDGFHQAAAKADQQEYFKLLDQQAIFLGTDGSERWTKQEFEAFVEPYFSKGRGWLYEPKERNVTFVENAKIAFFDELLVSKSYGQCRGSGVLKHTENGWKILQYNLSIPVPNALAKEVVKLIAEQEKN